MGPIGIIVGPFVGAVIGELMYFNRHPQINDTQAHNSNFNKAIRAGFGSFIGLLAGTLLKIVCCVWMAAEFVKMGFYIGVGGVVTFKNARKLVEVARKIPLERLLLETDCPYLAPVPYRGKRNCSLYLPFVVAKIAELKGIPEEEVIRVTEQNAKDMYRL
jgi:hypothetical protein